MGRARKLDTGAGVRKKGRREEGKEHTCGDGS